MVKYFCDWCGKEIGYDMYSSIPEHEMTFPYLWEERMDGEPTGKCYIQGKPKKYLVCTDCAVKIWRLRYDSTRA